MNAAIEISNFTKEFKTDFWKPVVKAVEDVSFRVNTGSIFGLIGPNGAGKTTTIKAVLGLIRATRGNIQIFGRPVRDMEIKKDLGYLPENAYYYDYLRAPEVIDFYGKLFGLSSKERSRKTDMLLELVGLSDKRDIRLRSFSKGMLQRIGIAQALVNDPKLVILDEPMSGLDPIGRKEVRDIILRLGESQKTILFSSHILSDVEAICEDVAIIVKSKLVAAGPLRDLVKSKVKSLEVTFLVGESIPLPEKWVGKVTERISGGHLVLTVLDTNLLHDVLDWARGKEMEVVSIIPQKDTLEDLFMSKVEGK